MNIIRKILGFLGFKYCPLCGWKLRILSYHGYDEIEYACSNPECEDYVGSITN